MTIKFRWLNSKMAVIAISLHVLTVFYLHNSPKIYFIKKMSDQLSLQYSSIGFLWKGEAAYMTLAAFLFGLFFNLAVISFECMVNKKWPRFTEHSVQSFFLTFVHVIIFGVLVFFILGRTGNKATIREISLGLSGGADFLHTLTLSMITYIIGMYIHIVDNFISGIYCAIRGEVKWD